MVTVIYKACSGTYKVVWLHLYASAEAIQGESVCGCPKQESKSLVKQVRFSSDVYILELHAASQPLQSGGFYSPPRVEHGGQERGELRRNAQREEDVQPGLHLAQLRLHLQVRAPRHARSCLWTLRS